MNTYHKVSVSALLKHAQKNLADFSKFYCCSKQFGCYQYKTEKITQNSKNYNLIKCY